MSEFNLKGEISCEDLGPMISAKADGELSSGELVAVNKHLAGCRDCQSRAERFAKLDQLVQCDAPSHLLDGQSADWRVRIESRAKTRERKRRLSWFATYAAAAVFLIAMIAIVAQSRPDTLVRTSPESAIAERTDAGGGIENLVNATANAAHVRGSLTTLQIVSRQEDRTYETMRKVMGWELRALQLELRQMELTPQQIKDISSRIDALIQRVEESGNGNAPKESGESI